MASFRERNNMGRSFLVVALAPKWWALQQDWRLALHSTLLCLPMKCIDCLAHPIGIDCRLCGKSHLYAAAFEILVLSTRLGLPSPFTTPCWRPPAPSSSHADCVQIGHSVCFSRFNLGGIQQWYWHLPFYSSPLWGPKPLSSHSSPSAQNPSSWYGPCYHVLPILRGEQIYPRCLRSVC